MESARTFLFVLFAFLTFLLYQAWQEDHQVAVPEKAPIESSIESYQPAVTANTHPKTIQSTNSMSSQLPESPIAVVETPSVNVSTKPIEVITDTLKVLISPIGGNFVSAELLEYKETLEKESLPLNMLENRNGRVFLALSGLYGKGAPDFDNNVAVYTVEKNNYLLAGNEDSLTVRLRWVNNQGVEYIKNLTFHRGKYSVDIEYNVVNNSSERIPTRMFTTLKRDLQPVEGEVSSGLGMKSYLGPAYSTTETKYEKISFDDIISLDKENFEEKKDKKPLEITTDRGWISIVQHYFVTAWVPSNETSNIIVAKTNADYNQNMQPDVIEMTLVQGWQWIEPNQSQEFSAKLYVGPKIQSELEKLAEGLELTVDYSFLWWIGQPIFFLLIFFQSFAVNWGLAIILVTIAIKTLLYPLARAQYRSFAKMRLLQPKMAAMKEQYGDDKQKMSMKMMEMYKKEKVNPLGGCFPLLIQMPVFISLYWVLMESVELRHAPFILWIADMSVKDPFYVMPLLMGASMYLMQKMQPVSPAMDPMQQKMMQLMPVFMTVFFVFFPAGLVLYWLMNNLISISQQLYVTKQFNKEQENKKKK